ncbi:MAG: pilus assembly protein [Candidatus Binatia bacterium]
MKKVISVSLIVCLLFWDMPLALADDSDIFGANIQPNVMILLDSSGSMKDTISTNPYDPNTTYPGRRKSTKVYRKFFIWYFTYANSIANVPDVNAQNALSTDGFWSGKIGRSRVNLFVGNYLNYQNCSACSQQQKKIDVAKSVITNLINDTQNVRFGLMKFRTSPNGGAMVAPIGTAKATMISALNAINPSGWTPLGEQLRDAGLYYDDSASFNDGTGSYSSPIQYYCQPSFVIIISDGEQNGSVDVRTEATNRFTQDHSSLANTQNVIVHTVGFNTGAAANAVLQQAATNGGGTFYTADNTTQLEASLQNAISQIIAATFSFSTPALPTTTATGSTKAYFASFKSDPVRRFWRGFLKAYQRDSNGKIPVDGNGVPLASALVWEAGQQLSQKSPGSRTIKTAISGALQDFTKNNAAITTALLGVSTTSERDKVVDFIRGIDAYDEDLDSNVTEERSWKLGDIFHSSPAVVSPPFLPSTEPSYTTFKSANAGRTTVVIAAANDGMVHAFRDSDGEELWAFIPEDQLGRLKDLAVKSTQHLYYVDSSPIAADIKIGGAWKTIVVVGQRRGGNSYIALDITDTTNPGYLWSFTDSKMGESWSEPVIGKVKMSDGTEKFVAFIGGGYDTAQNNNSGKAFFVIDLASGAKLWEYYNDGSTDGHQYMNFSLAANPTAVDLNHDGFVDRVYIGDVGGQLWKFDVSAAATLSGGLVTNWTGKRLFTAAPSQANPPAVGEYYPAQAIYAPPTLTLDDSGNIWLFFGAGDRNHPNNASANRFYGIKDDTNMTNGSSLVETDLTDVTSGTGSVSQGWFIIMGSNEKILAAADIFNKSVLFTSFTPVSTVACGSAGGDAKLYAVNMLTGDASIDLSTGQALASGQSALTMAKAIGKGIPSRPVVIIKETGSVGIPTVVTGTTNEQIDNTPAPPISVKRLVRWREVF